MANFTNYTKLQLIVDRTPPGADGILGGNLLIAYTITNTPTADANMVLLGTNIAVLIADTVNQVANKIQVGLDAVVGLTATILGDVVTVEFTDDSLSPLDLVTPIVSNGITATPLATDNRDGDVVQMKHSEYEDSESGLKLATVAMYSLVAASPATDSIQLQRIMLSSSHTALQTNDITAMVVGKDYQPYTI